MISKTYNMSKNLILDNIWVKNLNLIDGVQVLSLTKTKPLPKLCNLH